MKIIALLLSIITLSLTMAYAQKISLHAGIGYLANPVSGTILKTHIPNSNSGPLTYSEAFKDNVYGTSFLLASNIPVLQFNHDLAVGFNPGIVLFGWLPAQQEFKDLNTGEVINGSGGAGTFGIQTPIYLNISYGYPVSDRASTSFSGLLGIGYLYHGFQTGYTTPDDRNISYLSPGLMVELGYEHITMRFSYNLKKHQTYYDSSTGQIPKLTYRSFSITLVTSFYAFE